MVIKLILRILLFSSLILLISYLSLNINPDYKKEYVAAIALKLEKLKAINGPKIVLIGGSNACFGIDTELLERELAIPVVNMSLHGGLPLKFIIEQVKNDLNEGDILVLSKEYSGLNSQYWSKMNGTELPKIITYDWSQIKILITDKNLFESTLTGIFKTIKYYIAKHPIKEKKQKSVYSLEAFEGDNLKPEFIQGKLKKKIKQKKLPIVDSNSTFVKGLKGYKKHFNDRGIDFYLTPPVLVKGYYKTDRVLPFWHKLSKFTGISMLNSNKEYVYDKKYFYNSHYHTNVEGRRIRTLSLIDDFCQKTQCLKTNIRRKNIFIVDKKQVNEVGLEFFSKKQNFKVLRRDSNSIKIRQLGNISKNYFRMCLENKNYENYNLCINIECDTLVLNNIKFKGIGKEEEFDTIINLGNKKHELWKKVKKVFYKDKNSYMGVTLLNDKRLKGSVFSINGVELYKDFDYKDEVLKSYSLQVEEGEHQFLKIKSNNNKVKLKDILKDQKKDGEIELKTNNLYQITKQDDIIKLLDFYTRDVIFQTRDEVLIKSYPQGFINIFN